MTPSMRVLKSGSRFFLAVLGAFCALSAQGSPTPSKVVVYTYDSFVGKGTLGEEMQRQLRTQGIDTEFVVFPDAGEVLNQVEIEKEKTRADVVIGVDAASLARAQATGMFAPLDPALLRRVGADLRFDPAGQFVAYDYSWLGLIYDSSRTPIQESSLSLAQFADDTRWKKRVVIEDPRTSSVGRSFLLQTAQVFGAKEFAPFWKKFRSKLITVAPGWSAAYGMFLKGEVDLVLSYTSSPAYHCQQENKRTIRALPFSDGHIVQAEGVGLVRTSKHSTAAKKWIEALLSDSIQAKVPITQWMYPAVKSVPLPKCFAELPAISKTLRPDPEVARQLSSRWIPEWTALQALQP